jgi:sugar lactone lactonase YvrE
MKLLKLVGVGIALAVVCIAVGVQPSFAETYHFVAQWGSLGSGPCQPFRSPAGIAVDDMARNISGRWGQLEASSSGYVYVSDYYCVHKFDKKGTYITSLGGQYGSLINQFAQPQGVAVDAASGNVYVADMWNHRIQKFDSSGTPLPGWGSRGSQKGYFLQPQGVAVDASSNVYVLDTFNQRVQKFDSNGTFITMWGSLGSTGTWDGQFPESPTDSLNGKFQFPEGIAVDASDNVYVADTDNHRIQKFDSNGTFITKWGYYGDRDGEFSWPNRIAVDASGNVYVTDYHRVQKFDSNGTFITKWGHFGHQFGEFEGPQGVAVDALGYVYVPDSRNRVQKFSSRLRYAILTPLDPLDLILSIDQQQPARSARSEEIEQDLRSMSPEERKRVVDNAKMLSDYTDTIEKAAAKIK